MKRLNSLISISVFFILIVSACSSPLSASGGLGGTEEPTQPLEGTLESVIPDTGNAVPASTPIEHKITPVDLPADRINHAGDNDSSLTADQHRAPDGDRFTFDKFERPFSSGAMDVYFPYLDIHDFFIFQDETWVYTTIVLAGTDGNNAFPGKYALEIDLDLDGTGDLLVIASNPASTDWVVDGVQVWTDLNDDVGGEKVVRTDDAPPGGDGYETLLFDAGDGNDPDTAWVRIDPNNPNSVQIAVKLTLFSGDVSFLIGTWAGKDALNPALFDLNDHFTHEQAGTSLKELENFYPIKELSELDNTCRLNVGFTPNGLEPAMCAIPGVTRPDDPAASCTLTCSGCMILNPTTCTCNPNPQC